MKFEAALAALKEGKKVYFGEMEPFDLDGMPNLTGGDFTREDWVVVEEILTDDELASRMIREAERHEAEATEREAARLKKYEEQLAANPAGEGQEGPPKPRAARSSIAQTLRRCAEAVRTRQFPIAA